MPEPFPRMLTVAAVQPQLGTMYSMNTGVSVRFVSRNVCVTLAVRPSITTSPKS